MSWKHSWKDVLFTLGSVIIGFGMVAFYLVPAILDQHLVNIASMKGVSGGFREHLIRVSVFEGNALILINHWGSYNRTFKVTANQPSVIRIRTYYYPAWHLYVDGKPQPINVSDDGRLIFKIEAGSYDVQLTYHWNFSLALGLIISSFSVILFIVIGVKIAGKHPRFVDHQ